MVFPADCRICGAFLKRISRLPVCDGCLAAHAGFNTGQCSICGQALDVQADLRTNADTPIALLCMVCRDERPNFERAVAFGPYEGRLRDLMHVFKYERVRPAGAPLGDRLAAAMQQLAGEVGQAALIVPVPLHRSKERERGFNQAEALAVEALKKLDRLTARSWKLRTDVLERVSATVSQTGLSRNQRKENVRGAFKVRNAQTVAGKHVILVDDVMTTGVVADECARVLRRAGAEKVWVATVARVTRMYWGGSSIGSQQDHSAVQ